MLEAQKFEKKFEEDRIEKIWLTYIIEIKQKVKTIFN